MCPPPAGLTSSSTSCAPQLPDHWVKSALGVVVVVGGTVVVVVGGSVVVVGFVQTVTPGMLGPPVHVGAGVSEVPVLPAGRLKA